MKNKIMNKTMLTLVLILLAAVVIVGCAESRGAGYSTYGNVPPPRVSGGGGGCGVGAPALDDNLVTSNAASITSPVL